MAKQREHELGVRDVHKKMTFHSERSEASGEPKIYSSREYCTGEGIKSKRRGGQMSSQEKGIGRT